MIRPFCCIALPCWPFSAASRRNQSELRCKSIFGSTLRSWQTRSLCPFEHAHRKLIGKNKREGRYMSVNHNHGQWFCFVLFGQVLSEEKKREAMFEWFRLIHPILTTLGRSNVHALINDLSFHPSNPFSPFKKRDNLISCRVLKKHCVHGQSHHIITVSSA